MTTYQDAWECIENGPHAGGHLGTGGLMGSVPNSPGDPLFFLHHAFIDLLWWKWQVQDLDTRLIAIGGNNQPNSTDICSSDGETCPTAAILDYDGDDGNTTTLNHVLWMMDIYPNVTAADVMSPNSSTVCLEYVY
jgi:tyrosinase